MPAQSGGDAWRRGVHWYAAGDRLPTGIEAYPGREHNDLVLWKESVGAVIAGDSLADFGTGLALNEWLRGGVTPSRSSKDCNPALAASRSRSRATWRVQTRPQSVSKPKPCSSVGGPGIVDSWKMLARKRTLVSYGTASTRDEPGNPRLPVAKLIARLTAWNALPNGRRARFFNLWAGRRLRPKRYRAELREDLGGVLRLLAEGAIQPQIARTFALTDAAGALRYAEADGITGKVVLLPQGEPSRRSTATSES